MVAGAVAVVVGFLVVAEDLVEQVVFDLLSSRSGRSANSGSLCACSSRRASSRVLSVSSVAAMASDDDASSLRRMRAVRWRWRCGRA